jgi:serine/threonine-protein kinase
VPEAKTVKNRMHVDVRVGPDRREAEVARLVAEGLTDREIGEALSISPRTVETHVANIFGKLALEPEPDDHRRVLAVLTWLRGR